MPRSQRLRFWVIGLSVSLAAGLGGLALLRQDTGPATLAFSVRAVPGESRGFTRSSDGAIFELPANLEVAISGTFAVAPPNGTSDRNVLLLAAWVGAGWAPVEACGQELLLGGTPCLGANPSWLARAEPPSR